MKVLFLNPGKEMAAYQCLSAFVKQSGHRAALVNDPHLFDNPWMHFPRLSRYADVGDEILEQIRRESPDLIGISVVSEEYRWAVSRARLLKKHFDIPIVLGNIHPTVSPAEVMSHPEADFIVRGEGEVTLLELMDALERQRGYENIQGLVYRDKGQIRVNPQRELIQDMDVLPFPDKDLAYETMPFLQGIYTTMTGRGCPYRCTFCDNTTSMNLYRQQGGKKRWTRRHSPEYVVREIKWAKERYGIRHVRFNDEDWSYDKEWTREFCELYRDSGVDVPYFAWVYPNTITPEIARLMAESGCDSVEMGVQAGSKRLRDDILHRSTPDEKIVGALRAFRDAGIRTTTDLIVGLPTETKEELDATVRLINEGQPWHLYAFWLRYYPGSEITTIARERGILSEEEILSLENGQHGRGVISGGSTREKDLLTQSYQTFLLLVPILPKKIVSWLLRKDWIRFTPRLNPLVLVNITKVFKKNPQDEFRKQERGLWLQEGPRALRKIFRRLLRLDPLPEEIGAESTWIAPLQLGSHESLPAVVPSPQLLQAAK